MESSYVSLVSGPNELSRQTSVLLSSWLRHLYPPSIGPRFPQFLTTSLHIYLGYTHTLHPIRLSGFSLRMLWRKGDVDKRKEGYSTVHIGGPSVCVTFWHWNFTTGVSRDNKSLTYTGDRGTRVRDWITLLSTGITPRVKGVPYRIH